MADSTSSAGSGNTFLAFTLGAVVVLLAGLVYFIFSGDNPTDDGKAEISITVPEDIVPGTE